MPVKSAGKIFAGFYALYLGAGLYCSGCTYFYTCSALDSAQVSLGLIRLQVINSTEQSVIPDILLYLCGEFSFAILRTFLLISFPVS
jgi:hypothetical protein